MATTLISIAEYLASNYDPDRDYVDGILQERHWGEYDHSRLQTRASFGKTSLDVIEKVGFLVAQCAALASQFLTRMDPRLWPGPRLSRNLTSLVHAVFGITS